MHLSRSRVQNSLLRILGTVEFGGHGKPRKLARCGTQPTRPQTSRIFSKLGGGFPLLKPLVRQFRYVEYGRNYPSDQAPQTRVRPKGGKCERFRSLPCRAARWPRCWPRRSWPRRRDLPPPIPTREAYFQDSRSQCRPPLIPTSSRSRSACSSRSIAARRGRSRAASSQNIRIHISCPARRRILVSHSHRRSPGPFEAGEWPHARAAGCRRYTPAAARSASLSQCGRQHRRPLASRRSAAQGRHTEDRMSNGRRGHLASHPVRHPATIRAGARRRATSLGIRPVWARLSCGPKSAIGPAIRPSRRPPSAAAQPAADGPALGSPAGSMPTVRPSSATPSSASRHDLTAGLRPPHHASAEAASEPPTAGLPGSAGWPADQVTYRPLGDDNGAQSHRADVEPTDRGNGSTLPDSVQGSIFAIIADGAQQLVRHPPGRRFPAGRPPAPSKAGSIRPSPIAWWLQRRPRRRSRKGCRRVSTRIW